jgi:hypothetical protein
MQDKDVSISKLSFPNKGGIAVSRNTLSSTCPVLIHRDLGIVDRRVY